MKILVVYDTVHGNTEQIAKSIGKGFGTDNDVEVVRADNTGVNPLTGVELLVIGSPTHGGRFTKPIEEFFKKIPKNKLQKLKVAAFDTRTSSKGFARRIENFFGWAAYRIEKAVRKKGGTLIIDPEGFIVQGMKGPVEDGELERAEKWARDITLKKSKLKKIANNNRN